MSKKVKRNFKHKTICKVCDLLGLPHPQKESSELIISIDVNVNGDLCLVGGTALIEERRKERNVG